MLWFSAPCTGGSAWQKVSLAKGIGKDKWRSHWKLFKKLWKSFELVAEHALSRGATVFIEWPRSCSYWGHKAVLAFCNRHHFVKTDFDGCMYGLIARYGKDKGKCIRKPWRIMCSPNSSLPRFLNLKCDFSHEHARCAGCNTKFTQSYTEGIVKCIQQSLSFDLRSSSRDQRGRAVCCCVPAGADSLFPPAAAVSKAITLGVGDRAQPFQDYQACSVSPDFLYEDVRKAL